MEDQSDEIIAAGFAEETLTETEKEDLQRWLEDSPEHQVLYERFRQMYTGSETFRNQGGTDHTKAWMNICRQSGIHSKTGHHIFRRRSGVSMVAGFVLLTGIGVGLLWNSMRSDEISGNREIFHPGVAQVQLRLDNGKNIELTSVASSVILSETGIEVVCDSNELNYRVNFSGAENNKSVYNTLIVPAGAEYRLVLSDGTRVFMNAASELRYPVVFGMDKREVFLKGEAYFEVQRDTTRHFWVKTAGMDIRVLGTAFNVNAYPDANVTAATLTSGKIRAICAGKEYELLPGKQLRHDRTNGKIDIEEVNTEIYTCWKDGHYYFEACRLEEIMQTLSRWYGIDAFFQHADLKEVEFSGRLRRYEDISQLFRKFEQTRNICFRRKGNTVTVSRP